MGNELKFILDADGNAVEEPDVFRWEEWFVTHTRERIVARTEILPNVVVSTVFLGLNHRSGKGPPILWETMVFPVGFLGYELERYSSRERALAGHERTCKRVIALHAANLVKEKAHDPS